MPLVRTVASKSIPELYSFRLETEILLELIRREGADSAITWDGLEQVVEHCRLVFENRSSCAHWGFDVKRRQCV